LKTIGAKPTAKTGYDRTTRTFYEKSKEKARRSWQAAKLAMNGRRERNGVKRPDRIAGKSSHCAALRSRLQLLLVNLLSTCNMPSAQEKHEERVSPFLASLRLAQPDIVTLSI